MNLDRLRETYSRPPIIGRIVLALIDAGQRGLTQVELARAVYPELSTPEYDRAESLRNMVRRAAEEVHPYGWTIPKLRRGVIASDEQERRYRIVPRERKGKSNGQG